MRPTVRLYRLLRRLVITAVGLSVLLVGAVMIVTPGPALVFIPLGLAILGVEFVWARHALHQLKAKAESLASRRGSARPAPAAPHEPPEHPQHATPPEPAEPPAPAEPQTGAKAEDRVA